MFHFVFIQYNNAFKRHFSLINDLHFLLQHMESSGNMDIQTLYNAIRQVRPNVSMIRSMIEKIGNINEFSGSTLLHSAVSAGSFQVIQLLLQHGADVSSKAYPDRRTPLHLAAEYRAPYHNEDNIYSICKLLLENGANCNELDAQSRTPFQDAIVYHKLDLISLLVEYGADITKLSRRGETVVHLAADNGNVDVMEYLLDHGFDVNCTTTVGYTPLHLAARKWNSDVCEVLLKRGALVDKMVRRGLTPLEAAVERRPEPYEIGQKSLNFSQERTVQILLDFGAYRDTSSILKITDGTSSKPEIRAILLRHMAKMQHMKLSINEIDREIIENKSHYKRFYQQCLRELESMRQTKFYNNVSVLNILLESENVVSCYARNEELKRALEEGKHKSNFPKHYDQVKERFDYQVKRQRLQHTAAEFLGNLFNVHDPFHVVTREILKYLSDRDLKFLYL